MQSLSLLVVWFVIFLKKIQCGKSLKEHWLNYNESYVLDRWLNMADYYEKHFPYPNVNNPQIKMLEIGIQSGGSLRSWKSWYGEQLERLVGVDIDIHCMRSESPKERIFVEIGSQLNHTFLHSVCEKHGPFDMIIDDGGHTAQIMQNSLQALFPGNACMKTPSWYVIEDTHTLTMCDVGYCKEPADIHGLVGNGFYHMHSNWFKPNMPKSKVFGELLSEMHLYDSMIFFKRDIKKHFERARKGSDSFRNNERENNNPETYKSVAAPLDNFRKKQRT